MRLLGLSSALLLLLLLLLAYTPETTHATTEGEGIEGATGEPTTGGTGETTAGGTEETTAGGTEETTAGGTEETTAGGTEETTAGGTEETTAGGTEETTAGGTEETTAASTGETTPAPTGETTPETSPTTTRPPVQVLQETGDELVKVEEVVQAFEDLVKNGYGAPPAGARARPVRGHPAAWWLRGKAVQPRVESYDFCDDDSNVICKDLEQQLADTKNLVDDLNNNVEDWDQSKLNQLTEQREGLEATYMRANQTNSGFVQAVDETKFQTAVSQVKQAVDEGTNVVDERIAALTGPQHDKGGSVALVAVLSTLGGLMMVALVGTIGYKYYKESKTKHPAPDAPYNKLEGESIPIGRLSQEAPAPSQQAPRMNTYSQAPAPPPRRDPSYGSPYGSKSEASYGGRSEPRYASSSKSGGLPRAHL